MTPLIGKEHAFWEEQQRAPGFSGLACFRKRITVGAKESFGEKKGSKPDCSDKVVELQ